jgi:hypothetical protein
MQPRTHTPDREHTNDEGHTVTTIRMKRCCNGCGEVLGDVDNRDIDDNGNLTDVRSECDHCRPLVELEAAGCEVRQLTERSISALWRWIDNGKPFYISDPSNTEWGPDGCPPGLKVDGLSVFSPRQDTDEIRHDRHVARFGDWIIRHPDGQWTVHPALRPAA